MSTIWDITFLCSLCLNPKAANNLSDNSLSHKTAQNLSCHHLSMEMMPHFPSHQTNSKTPVATDHAKKNSSWQQLQFGMSSFKGKSLTITNQHQYTTQPFIYSELQKVRNATSWKKDIFTQTQWFSKVTKTQQLLLCCCKTNKKLPFITLPVFNNWNGTS
jgi:hypothetical protein